MKIAHLCLASIYVDNFAYQENILPRLHSRLGHEVIIIASRSTYLPNKRLGFAPACEYTNEDGIKVVRLEYSKLIPLKLASKLRLYKGLINYLEEFQPDLIYAHDSQFLNILCLRNFLSRNEKIVFKMDSHTDFGNSGSNFFAKYIFHYGIYRILNQIILPKVSNYYATTPKRQKFLEEVYGVPYKKIALLPFGYDSDKHGSACPRLTFDMNEITFITGGKWDQRKNLGILIEKFNNLNKSNWRLIIFGEIIHSKRDVELLIKRSPNISYLGWLSEEERVAMYQNVDIAIFSGSHSVLWEEVVGFGLPLISLHDPELDHYNHSGNHLSYSDFDQLTGIIEDLLKREQNISRFKANALTVGRNKFDYNIIAKSVLTT